MNDAGLDYAIMVAIVGEDPISYSPSGEVRAAILKQAINTFINQRVVEARQFEVIDMPDIPYKYKRLEELGIVVKGAELQRKGDYNMTSRQEQLE